MTQDFDKNTWTNTPDNGVNPDDYLQDPGSVKKIKLNQDIFENIINDFSEVKTDQISLFEVEKDFDVKNFESIVSKKNELLARLKKIKKVISMIEAQKMSGMYKLAVNDESQLVDEEHRLTLQIDALTDLELDHYKGSSE